MRYTIVNGSYLETTTTVNNLLKKGWTLQGGVSADGKGNYTQALIKIEENGEADISN